MEKYILIGIPGCGKTTLGEKVSERLKLPFFDTDKMTIDHLNLDDHIEMLRYKTKVRFYHGQYDTVKQLEAHDGPAIIATGAEVALMAQCASLLKKMGTLIYIKRPVEDVIQEAKERERSHMHIVIHVGDDGVEVKSAGVEAVKLYAKEDSQYRDIADVILNNDASEDEGVNQLASVIERLMKIKQTMKEGVV